MLRNALLTASLTGDPFIVLGHVAQQGECRGLIQPAPTFPNDSRGLACGLDDGVVADTQQHYDFP